MTRQTSIDAYNAINESGLLSSARFQVYDALYSCGPATAMQIFNFMNKRRGNKVAANVYARLSELRDFGVVRETGTIKCETTGMSVIQWDVTSNLPVKPEHKPKSKIVWWVDYCFSFSDKMFWITKFGGEGMGYTPEQFAKWFKENM